MQKRVFSKTLNAAVANLNDVLPFSFKMFRRIHLKRMSVRRDLIWLHPGKAEFPYKDFHSILSFRIGYIVRVGSCSVSSFHSTSFEKGCLDTNT